MILKAFNCKLGFQAIKFGEDWIKFAIFFNNLR